MSDLFPKAPGASTAKVGGLGPKAQKLQALREKMAQQNAGGKAVAGASSGSVKTKSNTTGARKTSFQRKAV